MGQPLPQRTDKSNWTEEKGGGGGGEVKAQRDDGTCPSSSMEAVAELEREPSLLVAPW